MTEAQLFKKREDIEEDIHLETFICRFDDENDNSINNNMDMFYRRHLESICLPIAPPPSPLLYTPLPPPDDQTALEHRNDIINEPIQREKDYNDGLWIRNNKINGFSNSSTSSFASLLRNKQLPTNNNHDKEKENKEKTKVIPDDNRVYKVQFKQSHKYYIKKSSNVRLLKKLSIGEFVKVEADRGEDLGIVCAILRHDNFVESKPTAGFRGRGASAILEDSKYILRRATDKERQELPKKLIEENKALMVCREKVASRSFPMIIKDAEYQFDRHKLSFYYEADRRIDFRELVSDLFALYKTRIWMQQIDTSFKPDVDAARALCDGSEPAKTRFNVESDGNTDAIGNKCSINQNQLSYSTFQLDDLDLCYLRVHNNTPTSDDDSKNTWY